MSHDAEELLTLTITYEPTEADMQGAFGLDEEMLWRVVSLTLARVGLTVPVEVSVLVTDDTGLRELNREFRGRDEATDVLSFPLLDEPLVEAPAEQLWQPADDAQTATAPGRVLFSSEDLDGDFPLASGIAEDVGSVDEEEEGGGADAEEEEEDEDVDDDEEPPLALGDIAISRDAVARQAAQAGHGPAWELAYLLAHGVLHLAGYDDATEAGYQAMVTHQEAVLAEAGIARDAGRA